MKSKDENLNRRGADNTLHEQEDTASRDEEKKREAGAKEAEAKAKKSKKSGK